jgi:chemotaxis family two-component system response regulator Rcp1
MIVDDNPGDSELITIGFESLGWSIRTTLASDGQAALEMIAALAAKNDCPQLIILDLNMPRINGFDVLQYISDTRRCIASPVVVMTTSNAKRDQERSLALGARACITKPPGFEDLLKILSSFQPYLQIG